MQEIVLNLDPSTWNVLKFIILAIIVTPLLEFLFQRFIDAKATYDVMCGKQVEFDESNLGLISLHSVYWGSRRNSIYLVVVASLVFATELIFEFSFSSQTVDVVEPRDVWLPLLHDQRYALSNGSLNTSPADEPFQFPLVATETCIEGEAEMRRTGGSDKKEGAFITGFEYHMDDTYVVRKPYLALDNSSVLCSASATVGRVSFFAPHVYVADNLNRDEGVLSLTNTSNSDDLRNLFTSGSFTSLGLLESQIMASDHAVCIRSRSVADTFECAMYVMNSFIFARTSSLWSGKAADNTLLSVILNATGQPVEGMKSRARRIRYLATVSGNRLLGVPDIDAPPSHQLVNKNDMESLAFLVLVVANEEGVGGSQHKIGTRLFVSSKEQTATMKWFAFIPVAMLVLFLIFLIVAREILSALTVSSSMSHGRNLRRAALSDLRVETSIHWLRERICDDLKYDGVFKDVSMKDISLKIVSGEVQMLPTKH